MTSFIHFKATKYLLHLLISTIVIEMAATQNTNVPTDSTLLVASTTQFCDGVGVMFCPTGSCYAGTDGFLGCCTVASCAARTTCVPYTATSMSSCDVNTGGCTPCTDPASPSCVTITNGIASQYIMYCANTGGIFTSDYTNNPQPLSTASPPSSTPSSTPSVTTSNTSSSTTQTSSTSSSTSSTSPSPVMSPSNTPTASSRASHKGGTIAGSVVGGVAGLAVLLLGFLLLFHHRRLTNRNNMTGPDTSNLDEKKPDSIDPGPFEAPNTTTSAILKPEDNIYPHATQMPKSHTTKATSILGVTELEDSPASNRTRWPTSNDNNELTPSSLPPSPPSINTNSGIFQRPYPYSPPLPHEENSSIAANNYAPYCSNMGSRPTTPKFDKDERISSGISGTSGVSTNWGMFSSGFGGTSGHASYLSAEQALAGGYREGNNTGNNDTQSERNSEM